VPDSRPAVLSFAVLHFDIPTVGFHRDVADLVLVVGRGVVDVEGDRRRVRAPSS
jgi:hypothetical protein